MSDDVDTIKKELDEVRRLKEELRREVEEVRREKEETVRRRADQVRREHAGKKPRAPRPPRRVRPVRPIRPEFDVDLTSITDSLEDMMEGLGQSIETSLKDIEGIPKSIRIPGVRIHRTSRKGRKVRKSEIEKIPPERVAKIVSPLGSEERLKILQFLKEGGKSFGEIEEDTQKFGSSLTHHLNPLVDAGYVVKGEVRGTYYLTVEGRLAYRLAQWLTHRVETQRDRTAKNGSNGEGDVTVDFEEDEDDDDESIVIVEDEERLEEAAEHLERVQDEIEEMQDKLEDAAEEIADAKEEELERLEAEEEDELDDFDWED